MSWRFERADHDGDWSFSSCTDGKLLEIIRKMKDFESMKMSELFRAGSEHGKHYDVPGMPSPALRRLEELKLDDLTQISRLRLSGPERLYGFFVDPEDRIFHVLWWDPRHSVWPTEKRNT
jgi:hypothetical protein